MQLSNVVLAKAGIWTVLFSSLLFFVLVPVFSFAQTATAPSGSGTEGDPYLIATLDNLYWVTQNSSSWSSYFLQTADIDASSSSSWDSGAGFTPIGNSTTEFEGNYNGNSFTISGLTINRSTVDDVGFFGRILNATIENIGLINASITGNDEVGILIGYGSGAMSINDNHSTGTVNGSTNVGGLIGFVNGSGQIRRVYSEANVNGIVASAGGLIGNLKFIDLEISYAIGDVVGGNRVGGLIGNIESSNQDSVMVRNSYAVGNITATGSNSGGLVGRIRLAQIRYSYSTGSVTGDSNVGGFIGLSSSGSFLDNYWNTETSGISFSRGDLPSSSAAQGLSTIEMIQQSKLPGFDFVDNWILNDFESFPYLSDIVPDSLPGADIYNLEPLGSGASNDPYLISDIYNLYWLSQSDSVWNKGAYFEQTSNIDASTTSGWDNGEGFSPIGDNITNFDGVYDGGNYTISSLFIDRSGDFRGLFGETSSAEIKNLGLPNVNISGGGRTGALIGLAQSGTKATDVYASGSVNGDQYVGGLVGRSLGDGGRFENVYTQVQVDGSGDRVGGIFGELAGGTVKTCYASGDVSGRARVGGLSGHIFVGSLTSVQNCYAVGSVTGSSNNVGGLVGSQDAVTIENSFATGTVSGTTDVGALIGNNSGGTLTNTYWNSITSKESSAIGTDDNAQTITDLSIGQMADSANFSGFDFSASGEWNIDAGFSFPFLREFEDHRMVVATIDSGEGWRMIGHPGDITYSELFDPLWTQGFEGSDAGTGFDANVYYYDESNVQWTIPSSADNYFGTSGSTENTALNGVLFYVYGDDNGDGNDDSWPKYIVSENTTLNDTLDVSLSFNSSVSEDSAGWHLVSNPYPVSLDWTEVVTNNDISNTFPVAYIWDDSLNAGSGAYRINYGYPLPPGLPQDLVFDGPIPAMQAFWVKATASGASLNFKPEYQTASEKLYKTNQVAEPVEATGWISLNVEHGEYADQLILFEAENYNVPKLQTIAFRNVQLSANMDEQSWVSRSLVEGQQEIPLAISSTETGTFSFSWSTSEEFFLNGNATLVDTETGHSIELSNENRFEFDMNESSDSRFRLVVHSGTSVGNEPGPDLPSVVALDQNYPNPFNPSTNIKFELPETGNVELAVFDVLGRKVATLINERMDAGYHQIQFNARDLASGMYLYQLRTSGAVITKKLMLIK